MYGTITSYNVRTLLLLTTESAYNCVVSTRHRMIKLLQDIYTVLTLNDTSQKLIIITMRVKH